MCFEAGYQGQILGNSAKYPILGASDLEHVYIDV